MQIENCRICKSPDLNMFLDLGNHPMADAFIEADHLSDEEVFNPLQVCSCLQCGLMQLNYVVSASLLYDKNYIYESSITRMGQRHWAEFSKTAAEIAGLNPGDLVIDIGSNVGVLLKNFRNQGAQIIGVDPANTIVNIALKHGIETIEGFFDIEIARRIRQEKKTAKIITATNVFAHIDDLHAFMTAVDAVLADDGVLIIEAPYAPNLIKSLEYDTIYHEHVSYLSLKPMAILFENFQMEIFEVHQRDIHGGSFRTYVRRQQGSTPLTPKAMEDLQQLEEASGIYDQNQLRQFANKVSDHRDQLTSMLKRLKKNGRSIAAVSAPAKGSTLLNYCGIGPDILDYITEKSELKIGRYSPGQHIPIVADEKLLQTQPDYAIILAWNFAEEIMDNLKDYISAGGKFIIPIPTPHILG
jgi:SAM-dependent methyltransferase